MGVFSNMQNVWPFNEAKDNLSTVVQCALTEGPQFISRDGQNVVVVLSCSDYDHLREGRSTLAE